MPRISAKFEFFFNLEPIHLVQINSFSYYSLKANLMQGEERIENLTSVFPPQYLSMFEQFSKYKK